MALKLIHIFLFFIQVKAEFSSYCPGVKVAGLKPPLLTVGFIIQQVLLHYWVLGLKQEVAVRAGHGAATVIHCSENRRQTLRRC